VYKICNANLCIFIGILKCVTIKNCSQLTLEDCEKVKMIAEMNHIVKRVGLKLTLSLIYFSISVKEILSCCIESLSRIVIVLSSFV